MGVEGGLAAAGAGEFLDGAVEHDIAETGAEDGVGLVEEVAGFREGGGQFEAHADGLGALAGEEEDDAFAHRGVGLSRVGRVLQEG